MNLDLYNNIVVEENPIITICNQVKANSIVGKQVVVSFDVMDNAQDPGNYYKKGAIHLIEGVELSKDFESPKFITKIIYPTPDPPTSSGYLLLSEFELL